LTYVITDACLDLKDRSCIAECPVDCIYEGKRMLYIQPNECIDCGACEPVCPVEAIYYDRDLPPDLEVFRPLNAEFFAQLGSPGGSRPLGPLDHDPPNLPAVAAGLGK
jgi:NAD-dependent dihydropyrimidine dehydrogenase PreA subunit